MDLGGLLLGSFGQTTSIVSGFAGINATEETAVGAIHVPLVPELHGIEFYVNFLVLPSAGEWGLGAPLRVEIL